MPDFREPIGLPQSGDSAPTPKVGIAPFGDGEIIAIREENPLHIGVVLEKIESKKRPAGGQGNFSVHLERPITEDTIDFYIEHGCSTKNATAINEEGAIITGEGEDFVRQGYYFVDVKTEMPVDSPHYREQNMKVNLWVDERSGVLQTDLSNFQDNGEGFSLDNWDIIKGDKRQDVGSLFMTGNEGVLRRLRTTFEAKMQMPTKGVTK